MRTSAAELEMPALRGPTAPLPREVYLEVTNRCNLRCVTCPRTFVEVEPPADLGYERMVAIVEQLPRVDRALLHGVGEPMLHPDLPAMIRYLAGRGARVVFNTNGTLLDERRGDAVTAAGLAELRVSLDAATPETFVRVRGADVLPRILHNLAAFTERRAARSESTPEVSIWATALRENLEELPDLVRLAAEVGVRRVHLQRLVYNGLGLAAAEQSTYRDISAREGAVLDLCREAAADVGVELSGSGNTAGEGAVGGGREAEPQAWRACRRPWKVLYVTARGNVMPCCIAPFATADFAAITLGNVEAEGVARAWNGSAMRRFRARHASDDPPVPCRPCGSEWSL